MFEPLRINWTLFDIPNDITDRTVIVVTENHPVFIEGISPAQSEEIGYYDALGRMVANQELNQKP